MKIDFEHMFWMIGKYQWQESYEKLNNTINYEEAPFRYYMAGICISIINIIASLIIAFNYIFKGQARGAYYVEYCEHSNNVASGKETSALQTFWGTLLLLMIIVGLVIFFVNKNSPETLKQNNTDVKIEKADFEPYMREIQNDIKANWKANDESKNKLTVVFFKVGKNGELLSYKVQKSSGSQIADNAALNAVKYTAPFKPLPKSFKGKSVDIQMNFEYTPRKRY